jgi:DNA polymerase (family 10)
VPGLDNVEIGVGVARKGWLEAGDVLNARTAQEVVAFARRRREVEGRRSEVERLPVDS